MHKNPELKIINEEERQRKSKKNKKPTACMDLKRSYFNCGICGSENIVKQGVIYCRFCDFEDIYLDDERLWFERYPDHNNKHICFNGRDNMFSLGRIGVKKCIDCGAVKGPYCPACGYPCWSKNLKKYCKRCGYSNV